MFETSDGGQVITTSEYYQIIGSPLPANVTVEMAQVFLNRLNSSLYLWNQGIYNSTNSTIDSDALIEANRTLAEGADKARQVIHEFVILSNIFLPNLFSMSCQLSILNNHRLLFCRLRALHCHKSITSIKTDLLFSTTLLRHVDYRSGYKFSCLLICH